MRVSRFVKFVWPTLLLLMSFSTARAHDAPSRCSVRYKGANSIFVHVRHVSDGETLYLVVDGATDRSLSLGYYSVSGDSAAVHSSQNWKQVC